jgi:hypothetical protein
VCGTSFRSQDAWDCIEPSATFADMFRRLDELGRDVGRAPTDIERTLSIDLTDCPDWWTFIEAVATHFIVGVEPPFRLDEVAELIETLRGA